MKTYRVVLISEASYTIEVNAEDPSSAIEAAESEGAPGLCHQCARIDLGDWLGDLEFVEAVE